MSQLILPYSGFKLVGYKSMYGVSSGNFYCEFAVGKYAALLIQAQLAMEYSSNGIDNAATMYFYPTPDYCYGMTSARKNATLNQLSSTTDIQLGHVPFMDSTNAAIRHGDFRAWLTRRTRSSDEWTLYHESGFQNVDQTTLCVNRGQAFIDQNGDFSRLYFDTGNSSVWSPYGQVMVFGLSHVTGMRES